VLRFHVTAHFILCRASARQASSLYSCRAENAAVLSPTRQVKQYTLCSFALFSFLSARSLSSKLFISGIILGTLRCSQETASISALCSSQRRQQRVSAREHGARSRCSQQHLLLLMRGAGPFKNTPSSLMACAKYFSMKLYVCANFYSALIYAVCFLVFEEV